MSLMKSYDHYKTVPNLPFAIGHKTRKPKSIAVVDSGNCTGCKVCIPFCPVDCIEVDSIQNGNSPINPVVIRYDECIGCSICAKVCTKLTWDAIHMLPLKEFEEQFPEVEISNVFDKEIKNEVIEI